MQELIFLCVCRKEKHICVHSELLHGGRPLLKPSNNAVSSLQRLYEFVVNQLIGNMMKSDNFFTRGSSERTVLSVGSHTQKTSSATFLGLDLAKVIFDDICCQQEGFARCIQTLKVPRVSVQDAVRIQKVNRRFQRIHQQSQLTSSRLSKMGTSTKVRDKRKTTYFFLI